MNEVTEELAVLVHALLAAGHGLAAVYNWRKAKGFDRWFYFHVLATAIDTYAVSQHLARIQRKEVTS